MSKIRTMDRHSVTTLNIEPLFTVGTIEAARYFSRELGTMAVDVIVGIIHKHNGPMIVRTEILTIPRARLLTGRKKGNIRVIRFNHLMNILYAFVEEQNSLSEAEVVTFMGLQNPGE